MVRWYFTGLVFSFFGTSAMYLVAGVWVKELTGSDRLAALALLCVYGPSLLAPLLGRVADSVRRRPLLIYTDLAMVLALSALFLVRTREQTWLVFLVMTIYGIKAVLVSAAEPALLVALLPPGHLKRVNGLRMSLQEGMKLVAPLAGASMFLTFGAGSVVALDATTFLLAAGATAMVRVNEPPPRPRQTGGLKHLVTLRWPIAGAMTAMFVAGVHTAASYPLVEQGLHRAPAFLGVLTAVQGAGSVLAGFLIPKRPVTLGLTIIAVAAALRITGWLPAVLTAAALHGIGLAWAVIAVATLVQRSTPSELLGRVSATATSAVFAASPVGIAMGAWLVGVIDYRVIYAGLGLAGAVHAASLRACPREAATDQME